MYTTTKREDGQGKHKHKNKKNDLNVLKNETKQNETDCT